MRVNFAGYKGRAGCKFNCPACGLKDRTRAFTVEHTVNPFNKNADGSPKSWKQVLEEARAAALVEREQFLTEPLCRRCEDALTYSDLVALAVRRRARAGQLSTCQRPGVER